MSISSVIFVIVVFAVVLLVFFLSTFSLKKLKAEVSPFYPFDLFFPKEGRWSVGYFLMIIIFLAGLIFFLVKGGFALQPA